MKLAAMLALVVPLFACSASRDTRCSNVCKQEAQCVEERADEAEIDDEALQFDRNECTAACTALLREERGKTIVDTHIDCVEKAGDSCEAVLACK
jgi:hypothetical protein